MVLVNKNSKAPARYRVVSGVVNLFILIILSLVIFAGIGYWAYKNGGSTLLDGALSQHPLKKICEENEGIWLEDYRECESMWSNKGLNKDRCEELGGKFDECTSACRHDPSDGLGLCVLACVRVCKF